MKLRFILSTTGMLNPAGLKETSPLVTFWFALELMRSLKLDARNEPMEP
jgi:hypothetical protein